MKVLYQCEACDSVYDHEEDARRCEASPVPEPGYEQGFRFGRWELRARRLGASPGGHVWVYDARAFSPEEGVFRYQEFSGSEIALYGNRDDGARTPAAPGVQGPPARVESANGGATP